MDQLRFPQSNIYTGSGGVYGQCSQRISLRTSVVGIFFCRGKKSVCWLSWKASRSRCCGAWFRSAQFGPSSANGISGVSTGIWRRQSRRCLLMQHRTSREIRSPCSLAVVSRQLSAGKIRQDRQLLIKMHRGRQYIPIRGWPVYTI